MRIIIPDNLSSQNIFKQLRVLMDGLSIEEFDPNRVKELPCLSEMIELTNPGIERDNMNFIYNTIFSKKGLLQVLRLMSQYMNFELVTYEYVDYNFTLIQIGSITTHDFNHFVLLFFKCLNALLFFGTANLVIDEVIYIIELEFLKVHPKSFVIEASNNTIQGQYNE